MSIASEREKIKLIPPNLSQIYTKRAFQKDSNIQEKGYRESIPYDFLHTYTGSLAFQKIIEEKDFSPEELDTLFSNLMPRIVELMCSKNANYCIQSVFKKLSFPQRFTLLEILRPTFVSICMDQFGNHSIQELINSIQSMQEWEIIESYISQDLRALFLNKNAHHVIQKIILFVPEEKRHDLNTFVLQNIVTLSLNEFGYLCILKFMKENRNVMIRKILINQLNREEIFSQLISDQYGSCIMNYAISAYGIFNFISILKEIITHIIYFSTLNETAVKFILKIFNLVNQISKDFYNTILLILLAPQRGFVGTLSCISSRKEFILNLVNIASEEVKYYFISEYYTLLREREFFEQSILSKMTISYYN